MGRPKGSKNKPKATVVAVKRAALRTTSSRNTKMKKAIKAIHAGVAMEAKEIASEPVMARADADTFKVLINILNHLMENLKLNAASEVSGFNEAARFKAIDYIVLLNDAKNMTQLLINTYARSKEVLQ